MGGDVDSNHSNQCRMIASGGNTEHGIPFRAQAQASLSRVMILFCVLLIFTMPGIRSRAEESSAPEYQVKAAFLLNFAKYVDWPAKSFATRESPIVIGVLGENRFGKDLQNTVKDKNIDGRKIIVRSVSQESEYLACHILFISNSEKKHLNQILKNVRTYPVLTVSELDHFTEQGGIIRFLKKDQKIRLEINLQPARQAELRVSSKLLSVADSVKGKQ